MKSTEMITRCQTASIDVQIVSLRKKLGIMERI